MLDNLPATNIALENGWLGLTILSSWDGEFSGDMLLFGRIHDAYRWLTFGNL